MSEFIVRFVKSREVQGTLVVQANTSEEATSIGNVELTNNNPAIEWESETSSERVSWVQDIHSFYKDMDTVSNSSES